MVIRLRIDSQQISQEGGRSWSGWFCEALASASGSQWLWGRVFMAAFNPEVPMEGVRTALWFLSRTRREFYVSTKTLNATTSKKISAKLWKSKQL